jgi:hypothetical protein
MWGETIACRAAAKETEGLKVYFCPGWSEALADLTPWVKIGSFYGEKNPSVNLCLRKTQWQAFSRVEITVKGKI